MNDDQNPGKGGETETPAPGQYERRMREMERQIRNMRLAIIVVVAFFIYDTLAPDGFRDRTHTLTRIETQELRVTDDRGRILMRLGANDAGGAIHLENPDGARLTMDARAIVMRPLAGEALPRLEILPSGVRTYGKPGAQTGRTGGL